jgi:hypothetical protein
MALHAYLHLALRREATGIDDGGADRFRFAPGICAAAMWRSPGPWQRWQSMPCGQTARVHGLAARFLMSRGNVGPGVVAGHAFVSDFARGERVIAIMTGIHGPEASVLRVPGERQLDQGPGGAAVNIGADMIAGAHDVIDRKLLGVDFRRIRQGAPARWKKRSPRRSISYQVSEAGW